jgi:hypothetical protein
MPNKPEPEVPKKPRRKIGLPKGRIAMSVPWMLVSIFMVVSLFLLFQYHQAQHKLASATVKANPQVTSVITKVQKLVVVPVDQTPTVATVQDVSKLAGQSFFVNAKNGDKVLVYSQEKEAILYRPSTNQIVTIAPVNVSGTTH